MPRVCASKRSGCRGPEAGLGQQLARRGLAPLRAPQDAHDLAVGQAPRAEGPGHERRARHRGPLQHALDVAVAIDREIDGAPHPRVVERRARVVDEEVRRGQRSHPGDHHARHRGLELVRDVLGDLAGGRGIEPPGLERGGAGPPLADDHVLEPVQVGPALHEVVRVLHVLDELAPPPLLELERAGAHAAAALLGHRHVSRVDRRLPRGQHHQDGGLGPLEAEDHRVRIGGLDGLDVGVPVLPRVEAQLRLHVGRLAHHVEGELDVPGRERLAVVPLHVPPQEEHQVPVAVLPGPLLGQLAHDGVGRLRRLGGIEVDQVVEARRGGPHRGDRGRLEDRQALGQLLPLHHGQDPAVLGGLRRQRSRGAGQDRQQEQRRHRRSPEGHSGLL